MAKKEILVSYGVDIDCVAGWLGSYGGENSPDDISRGMFAGEVGIPRLLKLFKKYNITASWFAPGHTIETFPDQMKMIFDAGHEIGLHGYSHENPISMTREQEEAVIVKCIGLIEELTGKKPTGHVAPWWEYSKSTAELLVKHGVKYDHSLKHNDVQPYYVRLGDSWTKIDYSLEKAEDWMKPLVRGDVISKLVQIPANWYLDDLPPMMFCKKAPNSYGFANPRDILGQWQDYFDYVYREFDYAVFPMTIHPDVSGYPHVLMAHERLIEYINKHEGVRWCTNDQIADDFIARCPHPGRIY